MNGDGYPRNEKNAEERNRAVGHWIIADPTGRLPDASLALRSTLAGLAEERISARACGLANDPSYIEDLELEVAETRFALSAAVVLQIALLRASLVGRHQG
jgi:hypothetical protein